jgi:hypothetical protein
LIACGSTSSSLNKGRVDKPITLHSRNTDMSEQHHFGIDWATALNAMDHLASVATLWLLLVWISQQERVTRWMARRASTESASHTPATGDTGTRFKLATAEQISLMEEARVTLHPPQPSAREDQLRRDIAEHARALRSDTQALANDLARWIRSRRTH